MAYVTSSAPASSLSIFGALRARLAAAKGSFAEYRRKREIYLRTLSELQSYRPHELQDLRIQADDIEELARRQAGW
jgi:uncharacterized protein YjiS (DUF1127 family)